MTALRPAKPRDRLFVRKLAAVVSLFAVGAGGCSVVLAQGPPRHGESDYDATGRYESGVPCTSSRALPLIDLALAVLAFGGTVTADDRDDREDGALATAAAAVSALIGYWRTNACRDAAAAAAGLRGPPPSP